MRGGGSAQWTWWGPSISPVAPHFFPAKWPTHHDHIAEPLPLYEHFLDNCHQLFHVQEGLCDEAIHVESVQRIRLGEVNSPVDFLFHCSKAGLYDVEL